MTNQINNIKAKFLKFCLIFLLLVIISSCAKEKTFIINGKSVVVEPYGWANSEVMKNDSIVYQASIGNVVWSIIGVETVIAPVCLTGWYLYEPVQKKK